MKTIFLSWLGLIALCVVIAFIAETINRKKRNPLVTPVEEAVAKMIAIIENLPRHYEQEEAIYTLVKNRFPGMHIHANPIKKKKAVPAEENA